MLKFFIFLLSPKAMLYFVASYHGVNEDELHGICRRESGCTGDSVGIHFYDTWAAKRMYAKAVKNGYIDLHRCPNYKVQNNEYFIWGVRGSFGLSAAYYLRFHPFYFLCPSPETLDDFLTGAWIAAKIMKEIPTCEERVQIWVGKGRWKTLSSSTQQEKIQRQCGRKS